MMTAKLLVDSKSILGEGAWYDSTTKKLVWIDIFGCEIHMLDTDTLEDRLWKVPKPVTTIVPAENGGYVLGMSDGMFRIDENFQLLKPLPMPSNVDFSKNRCNDGKCDPEGRFWVGVMELNGAREQGALYIIDDKHCTLGWDHLDVPNGIVWNSRGDTVYFTDTIDAEVYAFDYKHGELSNKRTVFKTDLGMTDGIAIDEEDMIWVAVWGSGRVLRVNPCSGDVIDYIEVGVPQVSSVAIGDGKIYITTASIGMSEQDLEKFPASGGLFVADTKLKGVQSPRFKS